MFKTFSENIRSFFKSQQNEIVSPPSGLKRKRPREPDDNEEDPDVKIVKVEKKRKTETEQSVNLLSKMASWMRSKTRPEDTILNGKDSRHPSLAPSSQRNGHPPRQVNGDGNLSYNNHKLNVHHHHPIKSVFPKPDNPIIQPRPSLSHNGFNIPSRRSSNSSSLFGRMKPSTASACIRLQEKEEYHRLLQLQCLRSPWETKVHVPTTSLSSQFEKNTNNSSGLLPSTSRVCDDSLFGTRSILHQGESTNEEQSIPRFKSVPKRRSLASSQISSKIYKDINLTSLLARQRNKTERTATNILTSLQSSHQSGQSLKSQQSEPIVVEDLSESRVSPTIIIDDDEHVKENTTVKSGSKEQKNQSSNLQFLNSIFIKDNYLDDFHKSRIMEKEEKQRQIEDLSMKVEAYSEKRRAEERALEKKMKYQMRIFDEQPEVSEEIFLSSDEEEEEETLPELTPEMNQAINTALRPGNPGEVLSKAFNLQITKRDMATLSGLNWLNDEIINFYMNMLIERGEQENKSKVHAFNTFFYPKIMSGGHQAVRRWTKKVDIFAMHYVLIPVHLGMHWCMCIANIQDKVITYYDSMGGRNNQCLEAVRKYINDESVAKKQTPINMSEWSLVMADDIPQQMNGSDCGMFSCKFAEYVTRGKEITFSQEDMPYFRRRMIYEIMTKTLLQ